MNGNAILGAGVDLVENERMRRILARWGGGFKDRVFLPEEQKYCESKAFPHRHYAARFAVKEAVSKAFGTGMGPSMAWLNIEVVRDPESGAPSVRLNGEACALAEQRGAGDVLISISHTRAYSVAQAIVLARPPNPRTPSSS